MGKKLAVRERPSSVRFAALRLRETDVFGPEVRGFGDPDGSCNGKSQNSILTGLKFFLLAVVEEIQGGVHARQVGLLYSSDVHPRRPPETEIHEITLKVKKKSTLCIKFTTNYHKILFI